MDPFEDVLPPKIMLEKVERDLSKTKDHIEQLYHHHVEKIKEWIDSPLTSQMKINLFLREWEKVKKRETESLIYKD